MGLRRRFRNGVSFARYSFRILVDHPILFVYPLIAAIAGLIYFALLWGFGPLSKLFTASKATVVTYVSLFVLYLGLTYIASFFTAGLMYASGQAMRGESPTLGSGLSAAAGNAGPLLVWAIISAVVGFIIQTLENSDSIASEIIGVIFSVGWSVITYFVIPVIVFEDVGIRSMFTRSKDTFVETWGESLVAVGGVGLVSIVFTVFGLLIAVVLFLVLQGSGVGILLAVAVGFVAVVGGYLFGQALTGITKTALYLYATEGREPRYFEDADFGGERSTDQRGTQNEPGTI